VNTTGNKHPQWPAGFYAPATLRAQELCPLSALGAAPAQIKQISATTELPVLDRLAAPNGGYPRVPASAASAAGNAP
jgi:hypothetical protein